MGCYGTLNLYAAEPDAFDDEIALLEAMVNQPVLALHRLRAERRLNDRIGQVEQATRAQTSPTATSGLAHDMNNLLFATSIEVEEAQRAGDAETRDRALAGALESVQRAVIMLRRLLSLTRRAAADAPRSEVDAVAPGSAPLRDRSELGSAS